MKHFYYTFLVTAVIFTSCNSDKTKKTQTTNQVVVPFTQQTLTNVSSQAPVAEKHNLFRENNATTASSAVTAVNPAHGQPNHRCDIPVGAPLNSAPAKNSAATVNETKIQSEPTKLITSKVPVSKVVTAEGMNPPHGEKGHRCDIAVGAPLNSKAAVNAVQSTSNTNAQYPIPALLATSSAETNASEETKNP